MWFTIEGNIIYSPQPLLFWKRNVKYKVRTEPKSGILESKPEPGILNLEAPIFSVHRAALLFIW